MTALGLLALWLLHSTAAPSRADERRAVATLRLDQLARLPADERDELMRLLWESPTPVVGGFGRQEGSATWH